MLHFAICDDESDFNSYLISQIQSQAPSAEIKTFDSSIELLAAIRNDIPALFEIFFLDIEMPNLNGIELAKQIRVVLPKAIIIFLTSHSEYVYTGYDVNAFHYISKNQVQDRLPTVLSKAIQLVNETDTRVINLPFYNNFARIYHKEIIYVARKGRFVEIITHSLGKFTDSRSLKRFYTALDDKRFVFLDRSTLINIDYIYQLDANYAYLRPNYKLPVGRRHAAAVKACVTKWLGESTL